MVEEVLLLNEVGKVRHERIPAHGGSVLLPECWQQLRYVTLHARSPQLRSAPSSEQATGSSTSEIRTRCCSMQYCSTTGFDY